MKDRKELRRSMIVAERELNKRVVHTTIPIGKIQPTDSQRFVFLPGLSYKVLLCVVIGMVILSGTKKEKNQVTKETSLH